MINLNDITATIKTFERNDRLNILIDSIKKYYPSLKILIADDGLDIEKRTDVEEHCILPFDVGHAWSRQFLLNKVKTKYMLNLDEDYIFNENTKLEILIDILNNNPDIDIIGGGVENCKYTGIFKIENKKLFSIRISEEFINQNEFVYCDIIPNFWIGNVEKIKSFGWYTDLKSGGGIHTSFFLLAKEKGLVTAFTNKIFIEHKHISKNSVYSEFRNNNFKKCYFTIKMFKQHDLESITYFNGITNTIEKLNRLNFK